MYGRNGNSIGKRKIALAMRTTAVVTDFHFYMQHSDGTWSHKMGSSNVSNMSLGPFNKVPLTNNNIETTAKELEYNDALKFFLISKDAIVDFPHNDGRGMTTRTYTDFKDVAGDDIYKCTTISSTKNARFDYVGDKSCFH